MPLDIPVLVVERARPDLKQPHRHPRSHLGQLDAPIARLDEDVVPDLDAVLDVLERDDPAAQPGRAVARREEVLQDLDDALAQRRREAVEDEVRVRLADGAAGRVGHVVAQHDVVQAEGRGRPVRQVRHRQRGGRAAVLVQQDDVAEAGGQRRRRQRRQHQVAAVEPHGRRQQQPHLLGEAGQPRRRVAAGGHEHARVDDAAQRRVLVVQAELVRRAAVRARLVVLVVLPQRFVVGDGGLERLAARERRLELRALLGDLRVAQGQRPPVDVVAPFAGLSALWGGVSRGCGSRGAEGDLLSWLWRVSGWMCGPWKNIYGVVWLRSRQLKFWSRLKCGADARVYRDFQQSAWRGETLRRSCFDSPPGLHRTCPGSKSAFFPSLSFRFLHSSFPKVLLLRNLAAPQGRRDTAQRASKADCSFDHKQCPPRRTPNRSPTSFVQDVAEYPSRRTCPAHSSPAMEGAFTHLGNHLISDSASTINAGDDESILDGEFGRVALPTGSRRRRHDDEDEEGYEDDDLESLASMAVDANGKPSAKAEEEVELPAHACA